MHILVIGGAGYIGSHTTALLMEHAHQVTVIDDLSSGHKEAISNARFIYGDFADETLLTHIFSAHSFDAIMHFASFIEVGESIANPTKYYSNNVIKTINLLSFLVTKKIIPFIFSSSASVYGNSHYVPIDESHPLQPLSPYARSKLIIEQVLEDYHVAYGLPYVSLRYFNVAGADLQGQRGESHKPETHLIPLILKCASGELPSITIHGNNYPTHDGTCIRDYIHVSDIGMAHIKAAIALIENKKIDHIYNLGSNNGFSIKEIIQSVISITGKTLNIINGLSRPGDSCSLIADNRKATAHLGWKPEYSDIDTIIKTAWQWEKNRKY